MAPVLYMVPPSPPVRSVQMTAKAIGLNLELKPLDFMKGENRTPEYLKMNPQHTVPTLVDDDGFTIWDSHAINAYLVSKYAKRDTLYPKDPKKRALVDQRMHFDSGVAFPTGRNILYPIFMGSKTSVDQSDRDKLNEVYDFLEAFLDGKQWMAGDGVTIADYHLFASVTSADLLSPVDETKYPRLSKWLKKVEALPEAEENKTGLAAMQGLLKSKLVN